jgi:hypothetical protein
MPPLVEVACTDGSNRCMVMFWSVAGHGAVGYLRPESLLGVVLRTLR